MKMDLSMAQAKQMLELVNHFFPEHRENYWNSGKGSNGSSEHIGLGTQHPRVKRWTDYTYIHWFELCMVGLSERLAKWFAKHYPSATESFSIYIIRQKIISEFGKTHPIDLLYDMWQNPKNYIAEL